MTEPKPLTAYQQSYHWRNKNCSSWSHEWIKANLAGVKVDDGKQSAEVVEVYHVSGDCDLGQRKGKLLTIYDLEVEMKWEGTAEDGSEVSGTLKIPEVSHEAIDGLSDYTFDFSLTTTSAPANALYSYLRTALPPLLKDKFNAFRPALLAAHGAPTSDSSPSVSGTSTPAASGSTYTPAPPAKAPEPKEKEIPKEDPKDKTSVANTATVEVKAELRASADDLWELLTDPKKIVMWSRSEAKMDVTPGGAYALFGGNVSGKIVSTDKPKKLVQTWQTKSPGWPAHHFGTMILTLDQGSESTAAKFTLEGVPTGLESDIERALDTYYIRGLKQMGLGTML